MFKNNVEKRLEFRYFDIQNVDGTWYAWYYQEIETMNDVQSVTNPKADTTKVGE